jgi:hypothetical protein
MPIPFAVLVANSDGTVTTRIIDAFSARWAERVAMRTLPEGASVLLAAPYLPA